MCELETARPLPVRTHLLWKHPKPPARLKIRGRFRVHHPAVSVLCIALAALSPRALWSGQLSPHGADAVTPLLRTPSPRLKVPLQFLLTIYCCCFGFRDDWWVMSDECGRVGRGGERLRTLRERRAQRLGRPAAEAPWLTRSQPPPPYQLHPPPRVFKSVAVVRLIKALYSTYFKHKYKIV